MIFAKLQKRPPFLMHNIIQKKLETKVSKIVAFWCGGKTGPLSP